MGLLEIDWTKHHILKAHSEFLNGDEEPNPDNLRPKVEPWLSSIFQSDHFSLLTGSGLTTAVAGLADINCKSMERIEFVNFNAELKKAANESAKVMGRGKANIEDDFRAALDLVKGLEINDRTNAEKLRKEVNEKQEKFIKKIISVENQFQKKDLGKQELALSYLKSFLISFSSRTAPRDRLNIFSMNYDRFVEYGCDSSGILTLDRFVGKIRPIFRSTKLELDYHYNPPGIRGEPRYVEGVVRLTKVHGSVDWCFSEGNIVKTNLPFGADEKLIDAFKSGQFDFAIYPNSSKDIETVFYPYSELFRDFSAAICRPNSALVTYGYGFGDSHINRIIEDMLTIPSTHIVIISYDGADGRIERFCKRNNPAQLTLLIGKHFGDLKCLVENYLPKSAIDRLTERMQQNKERRGLQETKQSSNHSGEIQA